MNIITGTTRVSIITGTTRVMSSMVSYSVTKTMMNTASHHLIWFNVASEKLIMDEYV